MPEETGRKGLFSIFSLTLHHVEGVDSVTDTEAAHRERALFSLVCHPRGTGPIGPSPQKPLQSKPAKDGSKGPPTAVQWKWAVEVPQRIPVTPQGELKNCFLNVKLHMHSGGGDAVLGSLDVPLNNFLAATSEGPPQKMKFRVMHPGSSLLLTVSGTARVVSEAEARALRDAAGLSRKRKESLASRPAAEVAADGGAQRAAPEGPERASRTSSAGRVEQTNASTSTKARQGSEQRVPARQQAILPPLHPEAPRSQGQLASHLRLLWEEARCRGGLSDEVSRADLLDILRDDTKRHVRQSVEAALEGIQGDRDELWLEMLHLLAQDRSGPDPMHWLEVVSLFGRIIPQLVGSPPPTSRTSPAARHTNITLYVEGRYMELNTAAIATISDLHCAIEAQHGIPVDQQFLYHESGMPLPADCMKLEECGIGAGSVLVVQTEPSDAEIQHYMDLVARLEQVEGANHQLETLASQLRHQVEERQAEVTACKEQLVHSTPLDIVLPAPPDAPWKTSTLNDLLLEVDVMQTRGELDYQRELMYIDLESKRDEMAHLERQNKQLREHLQQLNDGSNEQLQEWRELKEGISYVDGRIEALNERLGVTAYRVYVSESNDELGLDLSADKEGKVQVVDVAEGSPCARSGLEPGQTLYSIDGVRITDRTVLEQALEDFRISGRTCITVEVGDPSVEDLVEALRAFRPDLGPRVSGPETSCTLM